MRFRDWPSILMRAAMALTVVGCTTSMPSSEPNPTPTPGITEILDMGVVLEERVRSSIIELTLGGGRSLSFDLSVVRVVYRGGGIPQLLVSGRDAQGAWVALVGHQDDTPDGCHTLSGPGFEMGNAIAIAGIRWQKAATLRTPQTPPLGGMYPDGWRFCLNNMAHVSEVLPR